MSIILLLLGVSLAIGAAGLAFFLWSLRTGQYDDLDGAANRILFDDAAPVHQETAMTEKTVTLSPKNPFLHPTEPVRGP